MIKRYEQEIELLADKVDHYTLMCAREALDALKLLAKNASTTVKQLSGISPLKTGKLSSKYYLIDYKDIRIDFEYGLKVLRKKVVKVPRIVYPRCNRLKQFIDNFGYKISSIFNKYLAYDCGEALLVTLSYLELCQQRIDAIKDKKV